MSPSDPMDRIHAVRDSIAAKTARLYQPEPEADSLPPAEPSTETEQRLPDPLQLNTYTREAVVDFSPEPQISARVISGLNAESSLNRKTADFLDEYRFPKHK